MQNPGLSWGWRKEGKEQGALAGRQPSSWAAEELMGKWCHQEGTQGLKFCISNPTFFPSAATAYSQASEAGTIYLRLIFFPLYH